MPRDRTRHSTQARLALLLGFLAVTSLAGLLLLRSSQQHQLARLIGERQREINPRLDRVLEISGRSLATYLRDYSYWDEMVEMATAPDPAWGEENIAAGLATFDAAGAWIYDKDLNCVYRAVQVESLTTVLDPGSRDDLARRFRRSWFWKTYRRTSGNRLVEFQAAPIQPSADVTRTSPPQGWFIVARIWDARVLRELSELADGEARVAWMSPIDSAIPSRYRGHGDFVLERVLPSVDGPAEAKLVFHASFPAVAANQADSRTLLATCAGVILFLLLVALASVHLWVMRPLGSISRSLSTQDPTTIRALAGQASEFGEAAKLILRSYERRDELLVEIERRTLVEDELRSAKDAAEAARRSQRDFLAQASHEIRTPMNAILGLTDVVLESDLAPEQRDSLEVVRDSAQSLLDLLNDILDMSKLESGQFDLSPEPFDLRERLRADLRSMALRAEQKALQFSLHVEETLPQVVRGDPHRLRQVLVNLVGNAVKFTARGGVRVRVEPVPGAAGADGMVHFAVEDDGIGIAQEKLQSIFEPYTQAEATTARRFGGSGLGLSISEHIVRKMAGRIWCESQPGKGAVFHFTARFEPVADARPHAA